LKSKKVRYLIKDENGDTLRDFLTILTRDMDNEKISDIVTYYTTVEGEPRIFIADNMDKINLMGALIFLIIAQGTEFWRQNWGEKE
jgi:hypothetical protein